MICFNCCRILPSSFARRFLSTAASRSAVVSDKVGTVLVHRTCPGSQHGWIAAELTAAMPGPIRVGFLILTAYVGRTDASAAARLRVM